MKVKFADGCIKECISPTEHKVFKQIGGETIGLGWILSFKIKGKISSSDEVDAMLSAENVSSLEFFAENENGEVTTLFTLDGYEKTVSSAIIYSEDQTNTIVDIQLTKGV